MLPLRFSASTIFLVLITLCVAGFYALPFKRLHEALFYLALLAAMFQTRGFFPWRLWVQQKLLWAIGGYLIFQWISLGWSSIMGAEEYGEAIRKGLLSVVWMLLLAKAMQNPAQEEVILATTVIVAAVSAALALSHYNTGIYSAGIRLEGFGRSENAVQAGCLYGFALIIALWQFWQHRYILAKAVAYAVCWGVLLVALLATASRGALLATMIAHLIILIPYGKKTLKFILPIMIIFIIGIFLLGNPAAWLVRADGFRLEIWQAALALWQSHPLLGLGFRTPFSLTLSDGQVIFQPHSLYITALYYGGICGLLALLLVLGIALKHAWKTRQTSALPLMLVVYGVIIGLFDFSLLLVTMKLEWLLFWLPWAMVLAHHTKAENSCTSV